MEVELRHLRSVVAIAEERNFSRAAERLAMAQPALSQQIRRIEKELGADLFDRGRRPVRPTAAGVTFLEEAYITLEQADRGLQRTRRTARSEQAWLSIGALPWSHIGILPDIVRVFRNRVLNADLNFEFVRPADQAEALRTEQIDVGLTNWLMDTRTLSTAPLLQEPLVAIVPRDHRFARRSNLSLAELASEPFVGVSRVWMANLFEEQNAVFQRRGLTPEIVHVARAPLEHVGLVAAGLGVGLTLASLGSFYNPKVAAIPLKDAPSTTLSVLWRRDDDRELLRTFLDTAHDTAGSAPGPHP